MRTASTVQARPQHTPGCHHRRRACRARAAAEKRAVRLAASRASSGARLSPESVVAWAEWTGGEADPHFVVTRSSAASARQLYEDIYWARGDKKTASRSASSIST